MMFVKALQKKGVPWSSCGAVHEGSLLKCDVCGSASEEGSSWEASDAVQEGVSSLV